MGAVKPWFEVDRQGLAKLLARRGKGFVVNELIQNAWDTRAKRVDVRLKAVPGRPLAKIEIEDDDPEGFSDLRHAFTLFAESEKKGDPEKRGRFNLGEKLVLAICEEAEIETTTGSVRFDEDGRHVGRKKRERGSLFTATLRLTREELEEVSDGVWCLISPRGVETRFNGVDLLYPDPVAVFECVLPTEISDGDGNIRRTERKTKVEVRDRLGRPGQIYEMGIPVVETGDKYHVNILQKIPLNMDRDNVTPAYLSRLRTEVLNHTHHLLAKNEATDAWVREAAGNENARKEAIERVVTLRFGEKRVIADPSDPEGTMRAVSEGYTVIQPGSLSKEEWRNVKRDAVALPAGRVTPSAKPYSPDGKPLHVLSEGEWTSGMRRVAAYAKELATALMGRAIEVRVAREVAWPYGATYGNGELTFNLGRLGHGWFHAGPREEVDRLLLHEFAHEGGLGHLEDGYHEAACRLGAKLAELALRDPGFFKNHGR